MNKDKMNQYNADEKKIHEDKKTYKITLDRVQHMLIEQDGKCAICNLKLVNTKDIRVDHNRNTDKVRQLLCQKCNMGIGQFNDDPDTVFKAYIYLNKWKLGVDAADSYFIKF